MREDLRGLSRRVRTVIAEEMSVRVLPVTGVMPRRVATLSVHTSPLDQPGTGDAGGMNVYVVEVAKRLAQAGVEVEIFTRTTSSDLPPVVEMAPGVTVRHVTAGPPHLDPIGLRRGAQADARDDVVVRVIARLTEYGT